MDADKLVTSSSPWNLVLKSILLVLIAKVIWDRSRRKYRLPPGPPNYPILGCMLGIDHKQPRDTFSAWAKKYGKMYYCKLGKDPVIFVNDHKLLKEVFSNEKCIARPETPGTIQRQKDSASPYVGLVFAVGDDWKEHRRFVLRSFKDFGIGKSKIEDKIAEETEYLVGYFRKQNGQPFDNKVSLSCAIANIICNVLCNTRYDADDSSFRELLRSILRLFRTDFRLAMIQSYMWLRYVPPFSWTFNELRTCAVRISAYFKTMTKEHFDTWTENEERDLMDSYITALKRKEFKTFDESQLAFMTEDLMEAGFETTSTLMRWAFLLMCARPDIQKRVQEEIDSVLPAHVLTAKPSDHYELPYTEAVLCEVHRFSSFVPLGVVHSTSDDVSFEGYDIPKGTWIMPNIHFIHHDPALWEKPDEFRPERFLDANGKVNQSMDYFIPFSIGKRKCPGESLARVESLMIFTAILKEFNLSVPNDQPIDLTPIAGITLDTMPHKIIATRRTKST